MTVHRWRLPDDGIDLPRLVRQLRAWLHDGANAIELEVPDPDLRSGAAGGDSRPGAANATAPAPGPVPRPEAGPVAGGWRGWCDLAELLECRLEAPAALPTGRARLRLVPLPPEADWHGGRALPADARYADPQGFGAVRKLAHPGFALPLLAALERVRPPDGGRVLVLGCHRGDEVTALGWLEPPVRDLEVVGVDHAAGPLAEAAARFPGARFLRCDVAALPEDLGRFDLVVAIAVLHGPEVDDEALVRRLVQRHLTASGGLLLGWPNGRFRGQDPVWGARTCNVREPDLSLVVRDLAGHRRYLHQHGFRTHLGGRYDLLLTAWRGGVGSAERGGVAGRAGDGDDRGDAGRTA